MLLSDNRRGVQSTLFSVAIPSLYIIGQAWRRISGREGDAPVDPPRHAKAKPIVHLLCLLGLLDPCY